MLDAMSEIKTKGFYIVSKGDPSVGMFGAEWKLEGDFFYYADDAYVETFEERADWLKKEEQMTRNSRQI